MVLRADLEGLGREEAVAWVHAWCARSLAVVNPIPSSAQGQQGQQQQRSSTSTRPFGGASSATTAYQRAAQARPGLPDPGALGLPVKVAALTPDGARLVCQGLGPAFLDLDIQPLGDGSGSSSTLVVRQRLGERDLARHSASIKGLARATEQQVLEKLRLDLGRTLPEAPPAAAAEADLDALYDTGGRRSAAVAGSAATASASKGPPQGTTDVRDESGDEKEMDEGDFKELLERLGLAEALGLDEALGLGDADADGDDEEETEEARAARAQRQAAWADPSSPFAQKAMEAYETFVRGQAPGAEGATAEAMKGLGSALLEEMQATAATPDDVRAMFEQGGLGFGFGFRGVCGLGMVWWGWMGGL